jgi:peptidoglycan/LPS O-acetylase OafA/YrhL
VLFVLAARAPGGLGDLLRIAPLLWLGRVSFSRYLIHMPVLLALRHDLHDIIADPVLGVLAICLSLRAAWAFHILAERPAQSLARRISAPGPNWPECIARATTLRMSAQRHA